MTLSKKDRERNNEAALKLMFEDLGETPINLRCFQSSDLVYAARIDRTTCEDLVYCEYLELVAATEGCRVYRFTPKGWQIIG